MRQKPSNGLMTLDCGNEKNVTVLLEKVDVGASLNITSESLVYFLYEWVTLLLRMRPSH